MLAQTSRVTVSTLGTTSLQFLQDEPRRAKLILCNDSPNNIFLSMLGKAVVNEGIFLIANGGSYCEEPDVYGRIFTGVWSGIATVAGSILTICEVISP